MKSTYRFILVALALSAGSSLFAQRYNDTIILDNNQPIKCNIIKEYGGDIYFTIPKNQGEYFLSYKKINKIILSPRSNVNLSHLIDDKGDIRADFNPLYKDNLYKSGLINQTLSSSDSLLLFQTALHESGEHIIKHVKNMVLSYSAIVGVSFFLLLSFILAVPELVYVAIPLGVTGFVYFVLAYIELKSSGDDLIKASNFSQ